jgi:hypothetical protein
MTLRVDVKLRKEREKMVLLCGIGIVILFVREKLTRCISLCYALICVDIAVREFPRCLFGGTCPKDTHVTSS